MLPDSSNLEDFLDPEASIYCVKMHVAVHSDLDAVLFILEDDVGNSYHCTIDVDTFREALHNVEAYLASKVN